MGLSRCSAGYAKGIGCRRGFPAFTLFPGRALWVFRHSSVSSNRTYEHPLSIVPPGSARAADPAHGFAPTARGLLDYPGRFRPFGASVEGTSLTMRLRIPKWLGWPLLAGWTYFVLSFFAQRAIFHPSPYPEGLWDRQAAFGAEDVWLQTSDGLRIHGWLVQPKGESHFVTLYLHGNAGNITDRPDHIESIRRAGSKLLIIDYRGFGKSEGRPSEEGVYRDAAAAYDYLLSQGYQAGQIILHGESLGTAVATDLAARRSAAGLILEAPFPSVGAVAQRVLPVLGPLVASGFDTKGKIARVAAPVLVIHGDQDETIDFDFGEEVYAAANEPKDFWRVPGAHHNDIIATAGTAVYEERLRSFYEKLR